MQNCDKRLHCQSQATSCGEEGSAERTENLSYRRGKVPQQRRNKLFADMSMQPHLYYHRERRGIDYHVRHMAGVTPFGRGAVGQGLWGSFRNTDLMQMDKITTDLDIHCIWLYTHDKPGIT